MNTAIAHAANGLTLAAMMGLAVFGLRHGLFLATLAGMQVLAAFTAAMVGSGPVAELLDKIRVPFGFSLAAAYMLVFLISLMMTRLAVGAAIPELAVVLPSRLDVIGGIIMGSVAGYALAGAVLVGWSMVEWPLSLRLHPAELWVDAGGGMLKTFSLSCRSPVTVLEGEPAQGRKSGEYRLSVLKYAIDGNCKEAGEFLSSRDLEYFHDLNENGRRDLGLRMRYERGSWRKLRTLHPPRVTTITDQSGVPLPAIDERWLAKLPEQDGSVLCVVLAEDADHDDPRRFEIRPTHVEPWIQIDSATGVIVVQSVENVRRAGKAPQITVHVTDSYGLAANPVTVQLEVDH